MTGRMRYCFCANISAAIIFVFMLAFFPVKAGALVTVLSQTKLSDSSITAHWVKVKTAQEYYIGIGETEEAAKKAARKHTVTLDKDIMDHTFEGLKPGTRYYVSLRCRYSGLNGFKEQEVAIRSFKTKPSRITGVKQTKWYRNTKRVSITWDEQTAAYYTYVFMDENGKRIKQGVTISNSYSRKVDNDKCYSFKVRPIVKINGHTYKGEWSDAVYLFAQPMIRSHNYGHDYDLGFDNGKLWLKWDRIRYANKGYNIYISTKRDKRYVKALHVDKDKSEARIKNLKGKALKKSGTYYVYVEGVRKSGSTISTSGAGYVWEYKNGKVSQTYYHGK